MSAAALLTGITFILWGISLTGLVAVSATVLGVFAIVTGILWLVSAFYPIELPRHR